MTNHTDDNNRYMAIYKKKVYKKINTCVKIPECNVARNSLNIFIHEHITITLITFLLTWEYKVALYFFIKTSNTAGGIV